MKTSSFTLLATAAGSALAKVQFAGINIAGFDFGTDTQGTAQLGNVVDPGQDGIDQMKHFVNDDGLNVFRLPTSAQYLVNGNLGGELNTANWDKYDALIQGCLATGAHCIIDIHNYARWNGQIIGQGGPRDEDFAALWSKIATKYKSNAKVVFGIMNEPHDIDINTWATTVQAAVTAIREAGATENMILLPGNEWTHVTSFVSNGSGAALLKITNPSGTTDNLVFDIHTYLDSDGSGTHTNCVTNNVEAFNSLGQWLQENSRKAFLTETGGGPSDESCLKNLCEQFEAMNAMSDVYLGWVGWAAGKFDASYELSETPVLEGGVWKNQPLVDECVVGKFRA